MAIPLTDAAVSAIAPPADRGHVIIYDGGHDKAVPGFGMRITTAGARSYILNYRTKGGTERRLTIGPARSKVGTQWTDGWTATSARAHASKLRREIEAGGDPLGKIKAERDAETVRNLAARYLTEYAPRKRSRKDDEGLINQIILPELGARKVIDLQHDDIARLHRKVSTQGIAPPAKLKDGGKREPRPAPIRANRAVSLLSKMFTLAVVWKMRSDNPAKGIARNSEDRRERYLSGDEIGRLTAELAKHKGQATGVIRLLLLTGARRGEVLSATWDQFDLAEGVWTKPSAHTKQKKTHRVPLSAAARQLLSAMREKSDGSGRLFSDSVAADLKKLWPVACKDAKITGVRIHDLRHSYASILASSGLSLPIIGQLLGHTQPTTTARYAHLFDKTLRTATERVGRFMTAAESGKKAKIIEIDKAPKTA